MGILLEMKNINKSFGSNLVLQDVSLELHEGEVLALLGENGAGKSTLIKILGGIYTKDSGEIFIQGQAAGINSVDEARKFGISIIHQELMLAKDLSIAENIFMGNELCAKGGFLSLKSQTQAAQEKLGQYNLCLLYTSGYIDWFSPLDWRKAVDKDFFLWYIEIRGEDSG